MRKEKKYLDIVFYNVFFNAKLGYLNCPVTTCQEVTISEQGRIATYSNDCRILVCRCALELYYIVGWNIILEIEY